MSVTLSCFKAEVVTQPREKIVHLCCEFREIERERSERALRFWVGIDTKMTLHLISGTFFLASLCVSGAGHSLHRCPSICPGIVHIGV